MCPNTEQNEIFNILYMSNLHTGCIEFGDKIVMPAKYKNIMYEIENFEVRDTDIWIISYPKTGK